MKIERTFTIVKGANHWSELVGRFTDRLNTIADGFLMAGHTHYPNGTKIVKYTYRRVSMDLANYGKMMNARDKDHRDELLEEFYQLCDKSDLGFTKKYWVVIPKTKKC